jgi:hypothetical protein
MPNALNLATATVLADLLAPRASSRVNAFASAGAGTATVAVRATGY